MTFTAGQGNSSTQTVNFTPSSDTLVEGNETVTLAIANGTLLTGSGQTNNLVTIQDADSATVSFQSASTTVGEDGGAVNLVLVLNTAPGNTLQSNASFTVTATNGSASNADYDAVAFPKTVTFTAGQGNSSTQTVNFTPSSDTLVEGNETVTLAIANGPLLTGSGQTNNLVTIQDADTASVVVVASQSVTETGGPQPIAVRWVTSNGSTLQNALIVTLNAAPAAGTEFVDATFGGLGSFTFGAGSGNGTTNSSLLFTPTPDDLVEGDELALMTPTGSASTAKSPIPITPSPFGTGITQPSRSSQQVQSSARTIPPLRLSWYL